MSVRTRRPWAVAFLLAVVVAAGPAAAAVGPRSLARADSLEAAVLRELDGLRAAAALRLLRPSEALTAAAQAHSLDMVEAGYFGHRSSDGTTFDERILRFYPPRRRPAWAVGENLLWSARRVAARRAVRLWLASPGHRANLLDPRWQEVGIAAVRAVGAPGVYGGRTVIVLTIDFGVR